jgi:hypothetical protein
MPAEVERCPFCSFKHPTLSIPGMMAPYQPQDCIKNLGKIVLALAGAVAAILGGIQGSTMHMCPWCRSTFHDARSLVLHIAETSAHLDRE